MNDLILTKAKTLFFSYGLKSVSMEDLARFSRISKKTIYQFYPDKNELVSKIVEDLISSHAALFQASRKNAKNAVEEVVLQSRATYNTWSPVSHSFFHEVEKSFPEAWEQLEQHKHIVLSTGITTNLEKGIKDSLYRTELDITFMADARINQLISALRSTGFSRGKMSASQLMNQLTSFYLHGITTAKGKKLLNKYFNNK